MAVSTGSFTGNGTGQTITLGYMPSFLILKVSGQIAQLWVAGMANGARKGATGASAFGSDGITATATGFTVGSDLTVNENALTVHYLALRATTAVRVGSYLGNGTGQSVSGLGFAPNLVIVVGDVAAAPAWKSSAMGAGDSFNFAAAAAVADGITSLDADGFTVGTSTRVNGSGSTYFWLACDEVAGQVDVFSYAGTGVDGASVTGLGFQPDYVAVQNGAGAAIPVQRFEDHVGDASSTFSGAADVADRIQTLAADGFTVGTNASVNTNLVTYYGFAFLEVAFGGGPPAGTLALMGVGL